MEINHTNWSNRHWWIIALTAFALGTLGSWIWSIYILDEVKNASCAAEMLGRGDWIVPTFNGELRTDKPPLHYFAMRIAYMMGGINPYMARFGSGLMGVLTVLSSVWFAKKYVGNMIAVYTAMVLLASVHFCFEFHLAVPDPYLIAFTGLSCFLIYHAIEKGKVAVLMCGYISMGLAFLAKGPIAVAIPALSVFLHVLLTGWSWKTCAFLFHPLPVIAFLFITVPWYMLVHQATDGAWTEGFFLSHNLDRFSDTMEGHGGPFFMPFIFVLLGMLPFTTFVYKLPKHWNAIISERGIRFCLIVASVIVVIFSISQTKLPNYTMPAYPFFAIVIAFFIARLDKNEMRLGIWILIGLYALISTTALFFLSKEPLFFSTRWPVSLSFVPGLLFCGWTIIQWKNMTPSKIMSRLVIGFALNSVLIFTWAYPALDGKNPMARSKEIIEQAAEIVAYDQFNPAIVFDQQQVIQVFKEPTALKTYLVAHPKAVVISRKKFEEELATLGIVKVAEYKDWFEKSVTAWYELQ